MTLKDSHYLVCSIESYEKVLEFITKELTYFTFLEVKPDKDAGHNGNLYEIKGFRIYVHKLNGGSTELE